MTHPKVIAVRVTRLEDGKPVGRPMLVAAGAEFSVEFWVERPAADPADPKSWTYHHTGGPGDQDETAPVPDPPTVPPARPAGYPTPPPTDRDEINKLPYPRMSADN